MGDSMSLPAPINGTEQYLAAVLDELKQLNQRLAPRESPLTSGVVELREPGPLDPLPTDFPGYAALSEAGITLRNGVPRTTAELTAISGIGKATAKAILEALGE